MSFRPRTCGLLSVAVVATVLVSAPANAQNDDGWRTIEFETSEVTTPDVAVSPDGEWLIFTMLGHLFRLPVEGGDAEQLTFGPYYDTNPVFSPDGARVAFVSDRDGSEGNVFVVDPSTGAITQVTQEPWAARPTWTPDGRGILYLRMVYKVANPEHLPRHSIPDLVPAQVRRVELSGGAPETLTDEPRVIGSVFHLVDGRVAWAVIDLNIDEETIRASTRIEIMNADGAVTHLAALAGYAAPVIPSPTGDGFYYRRFEPVRQPSWYARTTDHDLGFLSLQDGAEQQLITLSPHRGWSPSFAVTADGASLYLGASGRLWKIELSSGIREPVDFSAHVVLEIHDSVSPPKWEPRADSVAPFRSYVEPRLAPDGRSLVFGAAGFLWQQPLDGARARRLFEGTAIERAPAFSPDGRFLAFVRSERGREEIRVFSFETRQTRTVRASRADRTALSQFPSYWGLNWSPDGQQLVLVESGSGRGARHQVVAVNVSNGDKDLLVEIGQQLPGRFIRGGWWSYSRPHLSADGQFLYFTAPATAEASVAPGVEGLVYRLRLGERAEPEPMTDLEGLVTQGLVSPDGKWLVFRRDRELLAAHLGENLVREAD